MEEVVRSLAQLSLSSEPKKELRHLRTALTALGGARDLPLPRGTDLKSLFDAFNTSDKWGILFAVMFVVYFLLSLFWSACLLSSLFIGIVLCDVVCSCWVVSRQCFVLRVSDLLLYFALFFGCFLLFRFAFLLYFSVFIRSSASLFVVIVLFACFWLVIVLFCVCLLC